MGIWKNILLKNIKGSKFKNAKTISPSDYNKRFQVFEVLITETLAIVDPKTQWHSLPVQGDEGIDFIGQIQQIDVPYLISKPNEVVLGQVKRRAGSYTKDNFHYDIIKIIEFYNKQYSQKASLFEIIHVLSTDKNVNPSKWIENVTYPYASYNILPVNAVDFLKFWKINPGFIKWELEEIYTDEQLAPLLDYINNLQEKWDDLIKTDISIDNFICADDEINIRISFYSSVELALMLYLEWIPSEINSNIVVVYPANIVKNSVSRYSVSVYKKLDVVIQLKAIVAGKQDLGKLNIYSSSGELISSHVLGEIEVHLGIANKFFSLPCKTQMESIKKSVKNNKVRSYKAYALIGQGGIGKSRLVQEISIFAQNQNYYTISVQNANDFSNSRNLILDMLIKILDTQETGLISYENVHEAIRKKLGANFSSDWNQPVLNYIINCELSDSDLEKMAKCILTLLIVQLYSQSIFVWLSDMHWASKETIILFKKLLNLLKLNKDYLNHSFIILFEGRDGDTLEQEEKVIFPYQWIEFCENENIEKVKIPVWSNEYSQDYIEMLINPMYDSETQNQKKLKELVEKYASGNPMHIKEFIHYLVEAGNVLIEENGTLTLINNALKFEPGMSGIHTIILKRIQFYQKKYPDIMDCYIILAAINANLSDIYTFVKRKLSKKYHNYCILEKDIGIVSDKKVEKIFLHEYYKELLKEQFIQNENILQDILNYYQKNCENTVDGQLDLISLKLLKELPDFADVSDSIQTLLQQEITDYQALKCYQIMTEIPQKFRGGRILSEIYFEMSEIVIRIASWKNSQKYLEKIQSLTHETEKEELYYILSCKNLGNMYGVGLELEKSVNICQTGLDTVKDKLDNYQFDNDQMRKEFERQYEMLLNRIAVTYWFSGQAHYAAAYQEKALESARKRNDLYAIAHTLYETGMCQLHYDVVLGNSNIERALKLLPEKGKYTEAQERYLVQTELLISQLLLFREEPHKLELLDKIWEDSEKICQKLLVGNVNYESALCHIVNAICYVFKEDYETALNRFSISLECANLGEFNTLRWKLYLNIAETYLLLYEQEGKELFHNQAVKYAKYGKKILEEAVELNKNMPSYLQLVETPFYYFKSILEKETEFPQNEDAQIPISVPYKKFCFYIMD